MGEKTGRRILMMLVGIFFISVCVGCYRLSGFGADAFTCMNLGISGFLDMQFGTWQLIMNGVILVFVFVTLRECIGAGTIVNMVCVGYGADLLCWLFLDVLQISMTMPLKVGALLAGSVFAGLGVAFYMTAELGIAPYDSLAVILGKMLQGKVPFQYMRICTDVTAIIIGVLFCLASGDSLWMIIGIGTICNACLNGPLIQFFRTRVTDLMLK